MKKLLIELPHNASTDKYDKYFPYPIHLLQIAKSGDILIDLNLDCYKKKNEEKYKIIDNCIDFINENDFDEIIVCAGSYIPDADKKIFYRYFLSKNTMPITLTGPYVNIFKKEIQREFFDKEIKYLDTEYNFENFRIPMDTIKRYPKVGNKLKVNMRVTYGCPRKCAMCPVPIIFDGKYKFYNINETVETIKYYYDNGVRFFNFIDDNLSCTNKFLDLLKEIKKLNLKKTQFICQEGFEVLAFQNEEFCQLIKDTNFVDIKLGIENVKEDFLIKINKYYNKFSVIEKAVSNIKKYNLDVKMYLLLGLDETKEDVFDNLKFISDSGFSVRCNIIRPYEGSKLYKDGFKRKLSDKELKNLKSLAHSISWLNEKYKINYFDKDSLEQLKEKAKLTIKKDRQKIHISGNVYMGFKTSKFIMILKTLLENKLKVKLKIDIQNKEQIIFSKLKV